MTPATAEALRVECAWCGHVIREGGDVVSHGVCETCAPLTQEPLYVWRIHDLALDMASKYGRYRVDDRDTARVFHEAKTRFTKALEKMVEDYEAEIRRLRVAAAETEH